MSTANIETTPELTFPSDARPQRLDVFLTRALPGASRARVRALIARGAVRVNGARRRKGMWVKAGDMIHVDAWTPPLAAPIAPNPSLSVPVLYEDADVIVVDKPPGMASHALRPDETETVANFLLARFPQLRTVGKSDREPGLVHRLDTGTSGVLLVARTNEAHTALRQQFATQEVRKEYVALVTGSITQPGEIRVPIAHDRRHRHRMRVCASAATAARCGARPATTRYRPVLQLAHRTLLAVEIATGVMHQIRVHLASIGHPIVGDVVYGSEPPPRGRGPRHMLHAQYITFTHPRTGKRMRVESPLPADLQVELSSAESRSHMEPSAGTGSPKPMRPDATSRRARLR